MPLTGIREKNSSLREREGFEGALANSQMTNERELISAFKDSE
jgi:hypothetical protein